MKKDIFSVKSFCSSLSCRRMEAFPYSTIWISLGTIKGWSFHIGSYMGQDIDIGSTQ